MSDFRSRFVRPRSGRVLIVGSRIIADDWRKRFPHGLGVDLIEGPGVHIQHDLEQPLADVAPFNHVECLSVLEHCARPWLVAENIERLMAEGATLYLSAPFAWRWHGYPADYWRITHEALPILFPGIHWKAIRYVSETSMYAPTKRMKGETMPRVLPKTDCGQRHLERMEVHAFGIKL